MCECVRERERECVCLSKRVKVRERESDLPLQEHRRIPNLLEGLGFRFRVQVIVGLGTDYCWGSGFKVEGAGVKVEGLGVPGARAICFRVEG